jgi:hypothetical protein
MKTISILLAAATSFAVPACGSDPTTSGDDEPGGDAGVTDEWDQLLETREVDYNAALRIAALRLTGDLPTMDEMAQISGAADDAAKKAAYEGLIRNFMDRDAFKRQMFYFWRDTFKSGETAELDTAPAFAAQLAAENRSYLELFTASTNTCPTFDDPTAVFTPAACTGTQPTAGVLTDPGIMKHYFGNLAFRRARWVQETFDCLKFPVEVGGTPVDVGGASPYIGVWPFTSISGLETGRIDFKDASAVVCANCHVTLNHQAPLFANFDEDGVYQPTIAVPTPLENEPLAELTDYLPAGESFAWRYQVPTPDLPAFGAAMAADTDVAKCGVARMWNWAMGKNDIVDMLQEVPAETIQSQLDAFAANGYKLKDMIFAVYTADDFVKF